MNTIAVIAAHPDDEILGCGATMARHVIEGDKVHVLLLADGESSRNSNNISSGDIIKRRQSAKNAMDVIGACTPVFGEFPDNAMDTVALIDVIKVVEEFIEMVKPNIIYTHHGGDLNIDHQITHRAVLTACRPLPDSNINSIYTFEVLSSTEWYSPQLNNAFIPVKYVNVENMFDIKQKALQCYDSEMRAFPHTRSYETVEALARLRGANVGFNIAEAFEIVRELV
jgi:N-acetylglucosamine malate deacetylase 1